MESESQAVYLEVYQGTVAEDIGPDTVELKVTLSQLLPGLSGPLGAAKHEATATLQTPTRGGGVQSVSTNITTTNYVTAYWWGDSVRSRPPLVKKGEQVRVTQIGDSDRYYWEVMGRDPELRQLDRFRMEISATQKKKKVQKTDANCYILEIDATTNTVMIKTSKDNEEPYAYLFAFDTKNGAVTLKDDVGNQLFIDSKNTVVELRNKETSIVKLDKRNVFLAAPDDVVIKAQRQIVMQAPQMFIGTKEGAGAIVVEAVGITFNIARGFYVKAKTFFSKTGAKFAGSIKATAFLGAKVVWGGGIGTEYRPTTINVEKGTGNCPDDSPDEAINEAGLRHAAAQEQMSEMAQLIEDKFLEVKIKTSAPGSATGIKSIADSSRLEHIRDQ